MEPLDRSLGLSRCKPEARLQSIIWGLGIPRGSVTANWCRYCIRIREHDPEYRTRRATHVRESTFPRCDFHWRFVCDECGQSRIFHGVAYCPRRDALVCVECSPEQRAVRRRFWGWSYYFSLRCPWHAGLHPALDRLEYEGRHPWQLRSSDFRARRWMVRSDEIPERWTSHVGPMNRVSDAAVRKGWDDISRWWVQRYTEKGDINREWVIDPVLLSIAGDVRDLDVLDAGCGNGYLSRILAKQGARVVGVDLSPRLLAMANSHEARAPLGVRFLQADLAELSSLGAGTFDLVISNVVLQDVRRLDAALRELHRVLRPTGRLVFSITHPAFDLPPARWVREPPDSDRPEERPFMAVDRYFDRVALYWAPRGQPELVSFHRPLRDFAEGLRKAGFVIVRLEEPRPGPEAIERRYRLFADQLRVPNFLIVEARKA